MDRKRLQFIGVLIFSFVFLLTFPFHYLKNWTFDRINKQARGQVQIYASDMGIGLGGLSLDDVHLMILSQIFTVESLSVLPSLSALLRGTIGVSVDAENIYGADVDLVLGRGFKSYYVSLDTNDLSLASIPSVKQMIPSIEGDVDVSAGFKLAKLGLPVTGSGSISIEIPKLSIPQKTNISGFAIPALQSLTPGLKGTVSLENDTLRLKQLKIGKQGQALWGTIDGTIKTSNSIQNAQLDLSIELTFGVDLKNSAEFQAISSLPMTQPYMKGDTLSLRLSGTPSLPQARPL